jgi:fibronectin-binding autotransporter adhesin
VTKLGAGTQTLSGPLTYSGATNVNGGTLRLVDPTTFNSGSLTVASGAKLEIERTLTDFDFSKPIGGAGSLAIMAGGGTITLSGNHGLTGATTVNSGTLDISGTLTGSATSVEAFATLKGNGHVGGLLTVKANAALSPGAGVGTLFADGGTFFAADSLLNYDLLGTDTTVGGGVNDLLSVTGNLTLDGTLNVSEVVADSFLSAAPGQKWRLMNYTGTLTNNGLDLAFSMPALSSDYTFVVDTSTANQVNLTVVPEPGAVLSMLGGLGVLAALRRRRK